MLNCFSVYMAEAAWLTAKRYHIFLTTPAEDKNKKYCFILMVVLNVWVFFLGGGRL